MLITIVSSDSSSDVRNNWDREKILTSAFSKFVSAFILEYNLTVACHHNPFPLEHYQCFFLFVVQSTGRAFRRYKVGGSAFLILKGQDNSCLQSIKCFYCFLSSLVRTCGICSRHNSTICDREAVPWSWWTNILCSCARCTSFNGRPVPRLDCV